MLKLPIEKECEYRALQDFAFRKEIQTRREEIRALLTESAEEEPEKLERELDDLDGGKATIARRGEAVDRINRSGKPSGNGDSGSGQTAETAKRDDGERYRPGTPYRQYYTHNDLHPVLRFRQYPAHNAA